MQTIILKDRHDSNPIELHCKDGTVETTENNHTVLDWGEIIDQIKEYHNLID